MSYRTSCPLLQLQSISIIGKRRGKGDVWLGEEGDLRNTSEAALANDSCQERRMTDINIFKNVGRRTVSGGEVSVPEGWAAAPPAAPPPGGRDSWSQGRDQILSWRHCLRPPLPSLSEHDLEETLNSIRCFPPLFCCQVNHQNSLKYSLIYLICLA